MDAKVYLEQAYRIDQRISSKMEQILSLRMLSAKAGSTISDMPGGSSNLHKMENIICKIVDLESDINDDISSLLDLKVEITKLITGVENKEHQTLLELRYLCYKTWGQIAAEMGYNVRHIYRLHENAVEQIFRHKKLLHPCVKDSCKLKRVTECHF